MSVLGWALTLAAIGCLLFGVAYQLDLMEIRYQARLRKQIEEWDASQRGSAPVGDFENYLNNKKTNGKEAA